MSVLIALGGGIENVPVIQRAKALGCTVLVVDGNAEAPGMLIADVPVLASCYHIEQVLPALGYALRRSGLMPDGVICAGVDAPNVAAVVASAYRLPGLTPEAARLSVDKVEQWHKLSGAGLPMPDGSATFYGTVDLPGVGVVPLDLNPYDLERWGDVVIKPSDSRGGRGVQRLKLRPDPNDEHEAVFSACAYARQFSTSGKLLGQKFLDGPQLSTESIVGDGRILFTAIALRNYDRPDLLPALVENGFDMPHGDAALLAEVNDVITRGCAALGWRTLTVKADLIIHDGHVVILELAARLSGGFLSTHGTRLAYGYDFIGDAIRIALGQPVYVAHSMATAQHVAQRYLFPEPGDIGRRVVALKPTLGYESISVAAVGLNFPLLGDFIQAVDADFWTYAVRPGDVLRPVVSHGERLGQAIATGSTPEQARMRAEAAVAAMKGAIVLK